MTLPILGGLLLILLFILLIFMKIKIELFFLLSQSDNYITIVIVALFGLVRIRKKFSLEEVFSGEGTKDIEEVIPDFSWDSTKQLLKNMKPALTIMKAFIRTIRISKLEWRTKIGTGDAALTGAVAGAIWAIKGALISFIRSFLFFKNRPLITVQPNFQGFSAETNIRCMVEMKTGKAMVAGIKMYKEWKKYQKSSQFNGENQKIVRRTING
ncbi:DUF2953 domain-containing protein [Lederbergia wuyishanensis]|uniref:DUF2953 domain-containing protein n=1 Tax=Lederbergia wuyishanensis TaxID=1347903 RepID=A0ABU0D533_9BACI|nr:DUF2953 domain-containing protein [Lederbergia wuyishanensis]MCJ8009609.1 DUF2953 domain-containing protein [Lederbergia wuyishanensis]MDQ0343517.1 hypothetical protein [Lederbergia wuyishanensis]